MRQRAVEEAVSDRDSGQGSAGVEETECKEESETNFLTLGDRHFEDVREDEGNEPYVGRSVNYGGGGHDGIVGEALSVWEERESVRDGVANHRREGQEDSTISADEADCAPDEDALEAQLEDSEVEEEDGEFGDDEAGLIEDDGEVGTLYGNGLVGEWDVFVLVAETEVRFYADEGYNGKGEDPGNDYEGVVPAPVLDQDSTRVDTSNDDEAADYLWDQNAREKSRDS